MSDEYTPTAEEVREVWIWQDYENGYEGPNPRDPAEFDRWLADFEAMVRQDQAKRDAQIILDLEKAWVTPEGTKTRKLDAAAAILNQFQKEGN